MFVVVETAFDRLNTSLKSFIFVCSQEVRPETVFNLKFIKTNFVSLCSLWLELCSTYEFEEYLYFHFTLKTNLVFVDELCVRCD